MYKEWQIVSEEEWKVTSQCLKYYNHHYKYYKAEFENFGTVTRSKAENYAEIENKMKFNRRRLDKHAQKRRNQIEDIERITEEASEYGVVLPPFSLHLDNAKALNMLGEILSQAYKLKMDGHELAVYEGRGELMHCLEDGDENLITRQQFRRG